ncbi:MAG: hypothetical protein RXS42_05955 [Nitrososphaeria archaeon]|jgi:hypothetical protein
METPRRRYPAARLLSLYENIISSRFSSAMLSANVTITTWFGPRLRALLSRNLWRAHPMANIAGTSHTRLRRGGMRQASRAASAM